MIFFSDSVDGRGILKKRRTRKPKIETLTMLVGKHGQLHRRRVNIERRPCPGTGKLFFPGVFSFPKCFRY